MSPYDAVVLLSLLLFGHLLADYPLQGQWLSEAKNRHRPLPGVPWHQGMLAHCGIHAGFVGLISGSLILALIELAAHAVIDDLKCAKRIGYTTDQMLHISCKILWVGIVVYMSGGMDW